MVTIEVKYLGDLRCKLSHGPSLTSIETDAPVDNHGRGESFSPTDLTAASLGACIATVLGILAQKKFWDFSKMKVTLKKEMSKESPRRIAAIHVEVFMPLALLKADQELVQDTALNCPVKLSLNPEIAMPIIFHWPR